MCYPYYQMILHSDREGNDCIRKLLCHCILIMHSDTGGPPLTRKSLTRFPLTRFLAYVRVSGGISVSRGPQYSPTNTSFM